MSKDKIQNNSTFYSAKKISQVDTTNKESQLSYLGFSKKEIQEVKCKILAKRESSILSGSRAPGSKEKKKIKWNQSAMAWTRSTSPSIGIGKEKRFSQPKTNKSPLYFQFNSQMGMNWKKGIKFSKDTRCELFQVVKNPSPHQYNCKRYLQTGRHKRSNDNMSEMLNPQNDKNNHIRGGSIGKFSNYWAKFCPYGDRRLYNERILKEAEDDKKAKTVYKISKPKPSNRQQ